MLRRLVLVLATLSLVTFARRASAQPPAADLMAHLATHAAAFETMRSHASYALDGKLEKLDGDGKCDSVNEMLARVVADGKAQHLDVVKYLEDGEDKTDDARKDARKRESESKEEKEKKMIRMPFLTTEQPRYVFDQVEIDRVDPARVRVAFTPKERAENTIEGSAWVDTRAGTVITAGFKMSKTPTFVDYVHITLEFGAPTPIGPAISRVTLEGKGGILFFRKRFRAVARLSEYRILP